MLILYWQMKVQPTKIMFKKISQDKFLQLEQVIYLGSFIQLPGNRFAYET